MFDSSIECLEDNQTDPKQVMREKIEKLEAEGDRVRGELGVCQKQLKDKCREISVLKRKMTVLEKQTKDIEAYKRLNRKMTGGADDGRIKLDDLLKEIESLRRERETTMEQYVRNNEVIMKKLQESESANRILRSNFDDAVERLEGYQCYINKIDIDNCRSIPHMRRTNVAASETNSTGQPTGQPKIIVMGDETARGLGWRLRSRLNDRVECLTKPGCTLENMVGNIHQSVTKASPGDTIIVLTGKNENYKNPRNYIKNLESIIELATEKKITLYINSIKYIKQTLIYKNVNSLIYKINCTIYNMTNSCSNVHVIETNCRNRLWEQIPVLLRFTAHKIPTNITIRTDVDSCVESSIQWGGCPVAGLTYNPSMGSSFSGRGRKPPLR